MESKTCKVCGRQLPVTDFPLTRYGTRCATCCECRTAALRQTKAARRAQIGGGNSIPFSDPDFDGKTIGDVWRQMCRAKKWLESRGCAITLDGEFREVKVRKLKPE